MDDAIFRSWVCHFYDQKEGEQHPINRHFLVQRTGAQVVSNLQAPLSKKL